jgi:hypothetical protein
VTKPKNGTSWGHSFFTIDMLGDPKLTLDSVNVTGLDKDYAILIEGVVNRLKAMGIKIGTAFLDREYFNLPSILTLFSLGRIKRMIEEHKRKNGVAPVIFNLNSESFWGTYITQVPHPDPSPSLGPQ